MTEKQFKILLNKFLQGKASQEEVKLIEKFENLQLDSNKDKVYQNELKKEQLKKDLLSSIKPSTKKMVFKGLGVAASLLILFGIGYTILTINNSHLIKVDNTGQQTKTILLTDGSEVILNQNSEITYAKSFNKKDRNLKLKGEAFFKVTKNKKRPFIINTGTLTTLVVGTEFNIKENNDFVHVTVTKGKVKVFNEKDTLHITKNEQAAYNIVSQSLNENKVSAMLFSLWQKNKIVLNNITLMDLSIVVKELYDIPFLFKDNESEKMLMSTTFEKNEPIKDIIDRINLINEVKLTLNKENMIEVSKVE